MINQIKLLELKQISKTFFGNCVLDFVNLELHSGEVRALVGENGAGKSTLVKIVMGEYQRDSGEIFLDGKPIEFSSPAEALNAGIAMIYQELSPVLDMTVTENIFLGREINSIGVINEKLQYKKAKEYLSQLGLSIDPKRKMRDLSIAEMQMVEISKIVSLGARVIIMDEPTSALSETEVDLLFGVIRLLKNQNVGIIYISHKLDELFTIADSLTVLRDGCVVVQGDIGRFSKEVLI